MRVLRLLTSRSCITGTSIGGAPLPLAPGDIDADGVLCVMCADGEDVKSITEDVLEPISESEILISTGNRRGPPLSDKFDVIGPPASLVGESTSPKAAVASVRSGEPFELLEESCCDDIPWKMTCGDSIIGGVSSVSLSW